MSTSSQHFDAAQEPVHAMSLPDTLIADVTQHDIDNGTPCNSRLCPVAWSIHRQFPGAFVMVRSYFMAVYPGGNYKPSREAANWIADFDDYVGRARAKPAKLTFTRIE